MPGLDPGRAHRRTIMTDIVLLTSSVKKRLPAADRTFYKVCDVNYGGNSTYWKFRGWCILHHAPSKVWLHKTMHVAMFSGCKLHTIRDRGMVAKSGRLSNQGKYKKVCWTHGYFKIHGETLLESCQTSSSAFYCKTHFCCFTEPRDTYWKASWQTQLLGWTQKPESFLSDFLMI